MARLVLTDASPLIALSTVSGLHWLAGLFGTVWMPEQIRQEVLPGKAMCGETEISAAIADGWLRVWRQPIPAIKLPDLDEGESACISIAKSHNGEVLLLMDERAGRAVAAEYGLQVTGTAAIIGMAKIKGIIPSARQVFEQLHHADFRISPEVINTVLARIGETQQSIEGE